MKPYKFSDLADEIVQGVGASWSKFPVYGATRDGLALAKERVGKNPGRYKPVTPGTIFYNPMRITIGSIALVDDDDAPGITSPDYVVLRPRHGLLHYRWFYYWFRSPAGARLITSQARGAVRERMLFSRLASTELIVPDWGEQLKVAEALNNINQARKSLRAQEYELDALAKKIVRGD